MSETVLVTIACHNRLARTVRAVRQVGANKNVHVLVVDDGSTDGTSEAIKQTFTDVSIIRGDGDLYWGGATNLGISRFLQSDHDHLLWLNDDVDLKPDSVDTALGFMEGHHLDIVVGCCNGPEGEPTYGGRIRNGRLKPTSFRLARAGEPLDTFNGNFVLFRRRVVEKLGLIDPAFQHGIGDLDYGLRAKAAGFNMGMLPEPVGHCERNPVEGSVLDNSLPRWQRLKVMLGPKGMPIGPWARFCFRHGGLLAPVAILKPYLNVLLKR